MRERINVLVHGEPKTGKTTFAVRRNPGVLVLDTEGSSKLIRGVQRETISSMAQMDAVLARIKSGEVKVVVIDTLDELVNNFAKEEVRRKGGEFVNKMGMLTMAGWGIMRDRFMALTRSYRDAGADVLTICHSELVEQPDKSRKYSMKLPSDYAREVMGMMDAVGFLEVARSSDGTNVRRLHLEKTPMFDAGIRAVYDAGEDKFFNILPPVVEDPALIDVLTAYDKFFAGEGAGFVVTPKCSNCAKKNIVTDATKEVDGMSLCDGCNAKYEEIKKSKV